MYKFEKNAENYKFWDVTDWDWNKDEDKKEKFCIRRGSDFL